VPSGVRHQTRCGPSRLRTGRCVWDKAAAETVPKGPWAYGRAAGVNVHGPLRIGMRLVPKPLSLNSGLGIFCQRVVGRRCSVS
jgi:hypothetical protein